MSGGAVLSRCESGEVVLCGVISSDISETASAIAQASGTSAIAGKIYPLLGLRFSEPINYCYQENGQPIVQVKRRLFDFIDGVVINDLDAARLSITEEDNGRISYKWSS